MHRRVQKLHLVLLSHGSRKSSWCRPLIRLEERLKSVLGNDRVHLAFLGHASPSLGDVVNRVGSNKQVKSCVHVLPLFISGGGHVDRDIPKQIRGLSRKYPCVSFKLLNALGEYEEIKKAIASIARKAMKL